MTAAGGGRAQPKWDRRMYVTADVSKYGETAVCDACMQVCIKCWADTPHSNACGHRRMEFHGGGGEGRAGIAAHKKTKDIPTLSKRSSKETSGRCRIPSKWIGMRIEDEQVLIWSKSVMTAAFYIFATFAWNQSGSSTKPFAVQSHTRLRPSFVWVCRMGYPASAFMAL